VKLIIETVPSNWRTL